MPLSPDGQFLAFRTRSEKQSIRIVSVKTGKSRELLSLEEAKGGGQIKWAADGRYLFFSRANLAKDGPDFTLWRIPARGGEPETLDLAMASFGNLSVHPDAKHLMFASVGPTRLLLTVWVMENFLPELASVASTEAE